MEENTMKKIVSERKIKHWQGYGSVDAKVLKKTNDTLVVRVSGNHEYGLDCDKYDTYRVYDWLVKRFCPNKEERDIESVDIDDRYEQVGNLDVEVCDYTIHFRGDHMWQESADDETLKDIEKTYGKNTARALDRYCKMFNKKAVDVVSDMKMDGNGMTEWDKFDVWARRKLKLDIMDNFDDTFDWTGTEERKNDDKEEKKREKDERRAERKIKRDLKELRKNKKDLKKLRRGMRKGRRLARESMDVQDGRVDDLLEKIGDYLVSDYGVDGNVEKYKFGPRIYFTIDGKEYYVEVNGKDLGRLVREGSGSRMEESDILDWIYEEMGQCEWAGDMDFLDDGNAFEVSLPGADGDVFKVSVQKVWSGRLGTRLD